MSGSMTENPFEGMSQEEIGKQWNEIVEKNKNSRGGKTAAQIELMNQLKSIDYSIRRKVIYNGKMAPQGQLYIVVSFKKKNPVRNGKKNQTKTTSYEAHQLIPGKMSVDYEFDVAKQLRQLLKEKYKV